MDIADRTDGQIRLVLQAGDGTLSSPYEYVVTVYVDEICYVSVHTEPADAVVSIYDADKVKIDPKNGTFELIKGATYSYTVSAPGYQSQSGTFKVKDNETKQITLKKGSDSQQEQLNAEWGSYWKTEDNQNILEAQTPESLSGAEVKWKNSMVHTGIIPTASAMVSWSSSTSAVSRDNICIIWTGTPGRP